jgi:hypothetical protein
VVEPAERNGKTGRTTEHSANLVGGPEPKSQKESPSAQTEIKMEPAL